MFRTILWATDGSPSADAALPYAKELAEGEGKTLIAVHCRELLAGRAAGYPLHSDGPELIEKIRGQVAAARADGLEAALDVIPGHADDAAHALADAARAHDADVIVAGTRGYAPLSGLLLGSVTQRLLHVAPCPVLAVHGHESADAHEAELQDVAAGG